jgi:calcium-dependent protein kinase
MNYDVREKIGEGGFGLICRAVSTAGSKSTQGVERALKYVRKGAVDEVDALRNEIEIQCNLDHPHVARLYEYFESQDYFCLAMQLCTGGDLFDRIEQHEGHFSNVEAAEVLRQMASGLNYCHSHGIIHRDVKPENFLYVSKDPLADLKIIDFGISRKYVKDGKSRGGPSDGTLWYMSPEMFNGVVDKKVDVWATGVVLFILLFGYPPFEQSMRGREQILRGQMGVEEEDWKHADPDAKELLEGMLCVDLEKRLTMAEVCGHPFVLKHEASSPLMKDAEGMDKDAYAQVIARKTDFKGKVNRFGKMNQFSRAALHMVASVAQEEDKQEAARLWELLDESHDGDVHLKDLESLLPSLPAAFTELFQVPDAEGDAVVHLTYTQFEAILLDDAVLQSKANCRAAFDLFATSHGAGTDLTIDAHSLALALGGVLDEAVCEFMIQDAGGRSGQINFDQFCEIINKALADENVTSEA